MRKQIGVQATPGATLAAATILSLRLGSIYAFSALLAPLEQFLHASRADLVSVFGVSAVFFTIGANLGPLLFGRHPARLSRPRLAHPRLRVAVRDWWRHGLRRQQCVNAAPLARSGLVNGYLVSLFPLGAMLAAPAHGLGLDWLGVRQTLAALAAVVAATAFAAALLFAGWLW